MDMLMVLHILNALLMIGIPIGLAIYLTRHWKLGWRLWFIGGATFILSQVGHIPFNSLVGRVFQTPAISSLPLTTQLVISALFLGLSAGLWEELFRYGMYRWWARDARSWRKGVLTGAGWGGAEAIILGALAVFSFVQLAALRNADLANVVPPEQLALAQQQVAQYWSMPGYLALFGALERLLTIPVQISMAVLVLQVFTRRRGYWLWLAVGYHALVDATAVLAVQRLGVYWTEALVAGYALFSLFIIFKLRQPEPTGLEPGAPAQDEAPSPAPA